MKFKKVIIMSLVTTMLLGSTLSAQAAATSSSYDKKAVGFASINLQKAALNPGTYSAWLGGDLAPTYKTAYFSVGTGTASKDKYTKVRNVTKLDGARPKLYQSKKFNTDKNVSTIALYKGKSSRVKSIQSKI